MKKRNAQNGSQNDNWETPNYVYLYMKKEFFKNQEYFDSCPLYASVDGLIVDWEKINYINPPYNRKDKEAFVRKAYIESTKGALCVMLIPASTETDIFHSVIAPHAEVLLIRKRIKFKGINSQGKYVTNKSGQSGSMFVIFGGTRKPRITTIDLEQ